LLAGSCHKPQTPVITASSLTGRWNMVLVTGGIAGIRMTAAQYGQERTYEFFENGRCTITTNGDKARTSYSTNVVADPMSGRPINYLYLANSTSHYTYTFTHDTLLLDMGSMVDGFTEWYVRR
jgi:hypothetical protein